VRTLRSTLALGMIAILTAVLPGCGAPSQPQIGPPAGGTGAAGDLVEGPIPFDGSRAVSVATSAAVKVRYRSTSGVDDSPTVVSGVVFVPKGPAPDGGWPIVSVGHPGTGVRTECAPSMYPDLLGSLATVIALVQRGFVVAMTDYEGLGSPGVHPFLEPKTAAYNVIDAARAARQVVPDASPRWVTYGYSQGGQASWAANEYAAQYGSGLDLLGSVSVAPAADLSALAPELANGTVTQDQIVLVPALLQGLETVHPQLDPADYLHGVIAQRQQALLGCGGADDEARAEIVAAATPADVAPATAQAAGDLQRWLSEAALPQRRASSPMYLAYGGRDQTLLPSWTAAAAERACQLGDTVETVVQPNAGHEDLDVFDRSVQWIADRFAQEPAPNSCPG